MLSHRFRNGRPARLVLACVALSAFGVLAASAATAAPAVAAARPSAVAHSAASAVTATTRPVPDDSLFVAYSGHNFGGSHKDLSACGVENMPFSVGSYQWYGGGQSGQMYNCKNAGCAINYTLPTEGYVYDLNGVGWKSILIVC
jgi:hypothetical protein